MGGILLDTPPSPWGECALDMSPRGECILDMPPCPRGGWGMVGDDETTTRGMDCCRPLADIFKPHPLGRTIGTKIKVEIA